MANAAADSFAIDRQETRANVPAVMSSRGIRLADEPAMQEPEEPMDPGRLVKEVEDMGRHNTA